MANKPQCRQDVYWGQFMHKSRCSRKAVKDGYCWQHHPEAVKRRAKQAEQRARTRERNDPWHKLEMAFDRIHRLERENKRLRKELEAYKEPFTR